MAEKMRIFSTVDDVYKALSENVPITQKFLYSHPSKTGGKSIRLSLGRIWFNMLLPSNYPLFNEPINKKIFSNIVRELRTKYTPEEASDYLGNMTRNALEMSTYIPTTFSIDSLILSDEVKDLKETLRKDEIKSISDFEEKTKKITKLVEKNIEDNGYRVDNIRVSGAKDIPWDKLMVAQGYVSDIENELLGPIKTAISDGPTIENFYKSAAEARRGFFYKAAISAKPGYCATRSATKEYKIAA